MSTTLTIPANVIPSLGEGLFYLMGHATQGIDGALIQQERAKHPEWFADDRRRLEDVFALLDTIGWSAESDPEAVEVPVREYARRLREAIDGYLPLLTDQEQEADLNEIWRAEQGKAPRKDEIVASLVALRDFEPLLEQALEDGAQ